MHCWRIGDSAAAEGRAGMTISFLPGDATIRAMIRAFVAVGLTPEIRGRIGEAERDFGIPGIRLVDPSLVHVTLKFLGSIDEGRAADVDEALRKVTLRPFTARMRSIGGFPDERRPRVIWVGAEGAFTELNGQVEGLLEAAGFPREGRFRPHVTIGRVKFASPEQVRKLPGLFEKYRDFDAGSMTVDSIQLMKSTLGPRGPRYDVLKEIPLAR